MCHLNTVHQVEARPEKRILLISPGFDDEHEIYKHKTHLAVHRDPPPIGLLFVATQLIENGYEVDIIDTHVEENYREKISEHLKAHNYIYAGMTVFIGKFLKNAGILTSLIREHKPTLPIVWGGIMASIAADDILNTYNPDYIAKYDGEEIAVDLAHALENGSDISGIAGLAYLRNGRVVHNAPRVPQLNLDNYPIPKWEVFKDHFNIKQVPYFFMLFSSRGCPFNCAFCYKHSVDENISQHMPAWRSRSAEHVIREIEYIHEKTGTTVFTFGDDNFLVNRSRVLQILDHFRKRNFYIEECIGHLNNLNDEIIDAMAGIVQRFIFSVETASPRLHKLINKNLRLETVPGKVQKLTEKGIISPVAFIIGMPSEELSDLRLNVEMMMKLKEINPFARGTSYFFLPLPRTVLFDVAEDYYKIELPKDIKSYEDANFWVKTINDPIGKKFRPWMSDEYFKLLVEYGMVFNDVFRHNNRVFSDQTYKILDSNKELQKVFAGFESINRPKTDYMPYVLDRVLKGENIDIINGLRGM